MFSREHVQALQLTLLDPAILPLQQILFFKQPINHPFPPPPDPHLYRTKGSLPQLPKASSLLERTLFGRGSS